MILTRWVFANWCHIAFDLFAGWGGISIKCFYCSALSAQTEKFDDKKYDPMETPPQLAQPWMLTRPIVQGLDSRCDRLTLVFP